MTISDNGFIVLHRKMIDWEWYDDIETKTLFIHCLLKANYTDKNWRGVMIKRGSFLTSLSTLAKETGLSIQNIRTSLNKLKLTNELTSETTNKYQVITIVSYDKYQTNNTQTTDKLTDNQQSTNNQLTTTNKDNNIYNNNIYTRTRKKKQFTAPTLDEVIKYSQEREREDQAKKFFDYYSAGEWCDRDGKQIKNWKQKFITWCSFNQKKNNFTEVDEIDGMEDIPY